MDIEEINKMWAEDCNIDSTDLGSESLRIPKLHNKYFILYVKTGLTVKKLKSELSELSHAKYEWLSGTMTEDELKRRGWKPNPLRILKAETTRYIENDPEVIKLCLKIDYWASAEKYLEDIIKQINNRNFMITNAINWAKFTNGIG